MVPLIDRRRLPGGWAAAFATALALALFPRPAQAWLFFEHRAISARGIETLDPEHRQLLDGLWSDAREGFTGRLCTGASEKIDANHPACVDLAAWPAIGGDHSCTARDMLAFILESDWILPVIGVAEKTGEKITTAKNAAAGRNAQTIGDISLQRTDKDYATRAGSNNAHFLLPRTTNDPKSYAIEALKAGVEPNAMAIYLLYHLAAMQKAAHLRDTPLSPAERGQAAREVLALEAFADHFLEDSFAAGHVAGSWGKVPERKGTHDYYNEHGIDAENWNHESMILFGDGHLIPEDLNRAGEAVRRSLEQVLNVSRPGTETGREAAAMTLPAEVSEGAFDICKATQMPGFVLPEHVQADATAVLRSTPIPFRGEGFASLPRFRAEIGSFIGLTSGVSGAGAGGGFTNGTAGGATSSLDVGVRLGLGLDALLGTTGDGLVFLEGSFVSQSRSSNTCKPDCPVDPLLLQFAPGVPARNGFAFRFRMPYWLVPGDLIVAAPILAFTDPKTLERMGITAANGGLIPWQTKLATGFGSFQFVAGREVSATLFGFGTKDAFLGQFDGPNGTILLPVAIKSVQWEFPILEYRPFREFGTRYTFSTLVQFGAGFDKPVSGVVVGQPEAPPPQFRTRVFGYVRLLFDGRRYY